jgi:ABC-type transporter Mla subunit MlaD
MTDVPPNKTTLSNVLGLKSKPKPTFPVVMDESQQLDESIKYAIAATNQLRDELSATKAKLVETTNAFADYKADVTSEMTAQQQEHNSKSSMLRATLDAREKQLDDTGRKLEHYVGVAFELATKFDDFERFYLHELRTIRDAANHVALGLVTGINNSTSALIEAAKHSAEGIVKQVENSANNMAAFVDDIKKRREAGEYRPKPNPMKEDKLKPLAPEAEEALADLVKTFKAKPINEDEE